MILTVTPNPSIDLTLEVAGLQRGEVHRVTSSRREPGGKGVNISRACVLHRHPTLALAPVGGASGEEFGGLLDAAGVPWIGTPLAGPTRTNIALVEPDGTTTKVNEPGPTATAATARALVEALAGRAAGADWVVISGAFPPGTTPHAVADLVAAGRAAGARVAVDSSGATLRAAVAARADLIAPNIEEFAELTGRARADLVEPEAVVGEAVALLRAGVGSVVVSLGAAGLVLVTADGAWHAATVGAVPVRSTVGAGDFALAGLLLSGGLDAAGAARAVAFGAAAVTLPGTTPPGPADVDQWADAGVVRRVVT